MHFHSPRATTPEKKPWERVALSPLSTNPAVQVHLCAKYCQRRSLHNCRNGMTSLQKKSGLVVCLKISCVVNFFLKTNVSYSLISYWAFVRNFCIEKVKKMCMFMRRKFLYRMSLLHFPCYALFSLVQTYLHKRFKYLVSAKNKSSPHVQTSCSKKALRKKYCYNTIYCYLSYQSQYLGRVTSSRR